MRNITIFLLAIFTAMIVGACAGPGPDGKSTFGDGKVDQVEAASIRVAVGLALGAKPEAVAPSYAVSTAVLALMPAGGGEPVDVSLIDAAIAKETGKLNLDHLTRQSFDDLVLLARAKIVEQIGAKTEVSAKLVVVREVVAIIQQSAAARLGVAK